MGPDRDDRRVKVGRGCWLCRESVCEHTAWGGRPRRNRNVGGESQDRAALTIGTGDCVSDDRWCERNG